MQLAAGRSWVPDIAVALAVLVVGLLEAYGTSSGGYNSNAFPLIFAVGIAVAVGVVRHAGWWSFGIVWGLLILQIVARADVVILQLAIVIVAFGLARWGSTALLWASGLSIPVVVVLGVFHVSVLANGVWRTRVARNVIVRLTDAGIAWAPVVLLLIAGALVIPWFAGLAARYWSAARTSERRQSVAEAAARRAQWERAQIAEIAELREGQARLARDVHDVVGHSLTVILAQAESAQFIDDVDVRALKRTMATIATSARTSLHEVRAVLASPDGAVGNQRDLDELIEASRASGNAIVVTDSGVARPLPPELLTVSFRVLQEMLTNAIKHGKRGSPITVTRRWDDFLHLTVVNEVDGGDGARAVTGNGLDGMRRRLESVGGGLELSGLSSDGTSFTVSAVLPVRAAQGRVSG